MESCNDDIVVRQLRRQVRLGSVAVYLVCAHEGNFTRVEVVHAPGLQAGQRFRLLSTAVAGMEVVDASADPEVQRAAPTLSASLPA